MTRTEQHIHEMIEEIGAQMTPEQTSRAQDLLVAVKAAADAPGFAAHDAIETERAEFVTLAGLIDAVCLREDATGRAFDDETWARYSTLAAAALEKRGVTMPAEFFA